MSLTLAQLITIMPYARKRASVFLGPLNDAMQEFDINTPQRMAAFLAQISHESGQLLYTEEIASGEAYEGRKSLGNTHPGWGKLYKGRGLIQLTGYYNYTALMMALGIDCVQHPEIVAEPVNACRSAAWYWHDRGLNALADLDTEDSFKRATKIINGGYNHLEERLAFWKTAKEVLCSQSQK